LQALAEEMVWSDLNIFKNTNKTYSGFAD